MSDTKKIKVNKSTVISCLKVLAFVLALIIALQALSATLFAKEKTEQFDDTKYYYSTIYTREEPNTIQVGLFGDSDLYSAFCPAGMFCMYGYTGTVVAAPRQTASESYYYLRDFIEKQNPELIVFECDMFYMDNRDDFENGVEAKKGLPTVPFINDSGLQNFIEDGVSVFRFHDRWKQYILTPPGNDDGYMHGYYFDKHISKDAKRSPYLDPTDRVEPMKDEDINYVSMAKELCDDKGIDFMLICVPTASIWSMARHNGVQEVADELGIKFLDLSIEPEGLNISYDKDFRDNGYHLNFYGARKVTAYASKWISENYELTNNRYNEDYAYWIDDLNKMYEDKGVKEYLYFKTMV